MACRRSTGENLDVYLKGVNSSGENCELMIYKVGRGVEIFMEHIDEIPLLKVIIFVYCFEMHAKLALFFLFVFIYRVILAFSSKLLKPWRLSTIYPLSDKLKYFQTQIWNAGF